MPEIALHNTLTRRKERFVPLDPQHVRMYVCGPTVYDLAHLGNARPIVVFDVLSRLLRTLFPKVTYVRNITDVDDKINARAKESGEPISAITARTTADFHTDIAALGALPPDVEPRATGHIPEMIDIILRLIASGHAYAAEGHVLFAVNTDPGYGKLSGHSHDELLAGARIDVAPYKRDSGDFVLWKPSSDDLPGYRQGRYSLCPACRDTRLDGIVLPRNWSIRTRRIAVGMLTYVRPTRPQYPSGIHAMEQSGRGFLRTHLRPAYARCRFGSSVRNGVAARTTLRSTQTRSQT